MTSSGAHPPEELSVKALAADIERYCAEHPHARDSLEGIRWWLAMQRGQQDDSADVQAAADYLVETGVLEKIRLSDGSYVFGCKQSRK